VRRHLRTKASRGRISAALRPRASRLRVKSSRRTLLSESIHAWGYALHKRRLGQWQGTRRQRSRNFTTYCRSLSVGKHLHRYEMRGREYGLSREGGVSFDTNARKVRIGDLKLRRMERFTYEYDSRDRWIHDIRMEATLPIDPAKRYRCALQGNSPRPLRTAAGIDGERSEYQRPLPRSPTVRWSPADALRCEGLGASHRRYEGNCVAFALDRRIPSREQFPRLAADLARA